MDPVAKLTAAIRKAWSCSSQMGVALFRLDLRSKPGIGGVSIDSHYRLYYDPEFIEARTVEELAWCVLSELVGTVLNHGSRIKRLTQHVTEENLPKAISAANLASDIITYRMLEIMLEVPERYRADHDILFCQLGSLSLEQLYRLIYYGIPCYNMELSHGLQLEAAKSLNETIPMSFEGPGSSGADGQPREWDDEVPNSSIDNNARDYYISDYDKSKLVDSAINGLAISSDESAAAGAAAGIPIRPAVSAKDMLKFAIRRSSESRHHGYDDSTYMKPGRRPGFNGFLRPSYYSPGMNICVIIDTSGSMTDEERQIGVGVVESALKELDCDMVRVICGDTQIISNDMVRNASQVKPIGNGGTDMRDIYYDAIRLKPKPDVVILVTDGDTPWPSRQPVPLVAALTHTLDAPSEIRQVHVCK